MVTRPLLFDFNTYTFGDIDFRNELIDLMINDLTELQQSLDFAQREKDIEIFRSGCHKANSTLVILNEPELLEIIHEIKADLSRKEKADSLKKFCAEIILSLRSSKT